MWNRLVTSGTTVTTTNTVHIREEEAHLLMATYTLPAQAVQARDAYLAYASADSANHYDDPPLIAALTDIYPKQLNFAYRASSNDQLVLVTARGNDDETALGVSMRTDNPNMLDVVLTECVDDRDIDTGTASPDLCIRIDTADATNYDPLFGYLHCWLMDVRVTSTLRNHFDTVVHAAPAPAPAVAQ